MPEAEGMIAIECYAHAKADTSVKRVNFLIDIAESDDRKPIALRSRRYIFVTSSSRRTS